MSILDRIRSEPALVSGLVVVLLNVAAAFGFDLTAEQTAAVNGLVVALLAFVVRSQVSPIARPGKHAA